MKFFKLGKGKKDTKKESKREMEGEPDPIDYVLPSNISEYYRQLRSLKELENYQPENKKEKIKIYEQIVDKATVMSLLTENDYTDKIVKYSKELSDIFEGTEEEDKQMKRKAYVSIAKNPKRYLKTAEDFYGEKLEHITETKEDKIESVLEKVEEER
ncbi:MAG: hypothetical protein ACOC5D_02310 [Thermoplasmatota archaeon]